MSRVETETNPEIRQFYLHSLGLLAIAINQGVPKTPFPSLEVNQSLKLLSISDFKEIDQSKIGLHNLGLAWLGLSFSTNLEPIDDLLPQVDQKTLAFFQKTIADSEVVKHYVNNEVPNQTPTDRLSSLNLLGLYYYFHLSFRGIATIKQILERQEKPITSSGSRLIVENVIKRLWKNSSSEIQEEYPEKTIPIGKIDQSDLSKYFVGQQPVHVLIRKLILEEPADEIIQTLTAKQIILARKILSRYGLGFLLPRKLKDHHQLVARIEEETEFKDLQLALNEVNRYFLNRHRGKLLSSFRDLLEQADLPKTTSREKLERIKELLILNQIAVGLISIQRKNKKEQRYYFIAFKDLDKAAKIIKKNRLFFGVIKH